MAVAMLLPWTSVQDVRTCVPRAVYAATGGMANDGRHGLTGVA